MKKTWEKIFEYASMPVQGTMSRRLRKGVSLQINEGKVFETGVLFLDEGFVRITEEGNKQPTINSYYDWTKISSIRTLSVKE
jgi:hypothetical protein